MKKIEFYGNKNVIFEFIKINRMKMGLTQAELAAKLQLMNVNIDQQMVSKIENNTRMVTDYELICLCSVLNIELREILADFSEKYIKSV